MLDWDKMDEWKLLLVDDEPDNIEVVAESLEFYGMTVRTAENGKIAMEMVEGYLPDLILLDLSMPVMDGWQTLRQLKLNPQTQTIPILALSAHAILGDKERALEVGFDGYMTKPVDVPNLIRDLKAALANRSVSEIPITLASKPAAPETITSETPVVRAESEPAPVTQPVAQAATEPAAQAAPQEDKA